MEFGYLKSINTFFRAKALHQGSEVLKIDFKVALEGDQNDFNKNTNTHSLSDHIFSMK